MEKNTLHTIETVHPDFYQLLFYQILQSSPQTLLPGLTGFFLNGPLPVLLK